MAEELEVPQTTLRDTIAEQFDALEPEPPTPAPAFEPAPSQEDAAAQDAGDKPGRTAGRARDEHGRLLPGKPEKPPEVPQQVPAAATPGTAAPVSPPVVEPPVQRPSSWKKEMWPQWDSLPRDVQAYVNQRESEFAKGVSTYRQEYENTRPVMEAIAPHLPLLQQHGIDPGQQVARYMQVHKVLAMGAPQEKLGLFAQLAKDYSVPLHELFEQGQDGKVYIRNLQYTAPAPQAPDVERIIESKLIEKEAQQAARMFTEAKDASGNPLHPHFETVRPAMSQLLAAGLAQDLESAYDAALRLPQHSQLFEQLQQQKQTQDEAEKQKKLAEQAGLARRNAVSIKSATPATKGASPAKGLRGALEDAFDAHIPGRV